LLPIKRTIAIALACTALMGCAKEATGQVAAVVNGDEITLQEINAELGGMTPPSGVSKEALQQQALQRIIERRLLAQVARDDGIEKTQDYLLRERQLRDALLVQLLGQKTERALKIPDEQQVDSYIASHPTMFADRKVYAIDRIQFAVPEDPSRLKALEDDHSMAAVADRLRSLGIEFRRDAGQMDSAQIPAQMLQRIQSLPPGEPFVVPENGVVTVGLITGERSDPISGAQARQIAQQAMRNEQLQQTLDQRLKQSRQTADIEYQEGFAPPKDANAAGDAPASKTAEPAN